MVLEGDLQELSREHNEDTKEEDNDDNTERGDNDNIEDGVVEGLESSGYHQETGPLETGDSPTSR